MIQLTIIAALIVAENLKALTALAAIAVACGAASAGWFVIASVTLLSRRQHDFRIGPRSGNSDFGALCLKRATSFKDLFCRGLSPGPLGSLRPGCMRLPGHVLCGCLVTFCAAAWSIVQRAKHARDLW